jgi:xanthine/uracil permease
MANEYALAYTAPREIDRSLLPVIAFIGLLLLIYVGLDAFSPPPLVSQFGGVREASRSDVVRQIAYLGVAAMIGIAALQRFGIGLLRAIPVSMGILLAWCMASAMWAPDTSIVLRRAGLEIVVVVSLMLTLVLLLVVVVLMLLLLLLLC